MIVETKNVTIAGPSMTPQKPNVVMPAIIAKKMSSSFIYVGILTSFEFINLMTSGFSSVSAPNEITMIV